MIIIPEEYERFTVLKVKGALDNMGADALHKQLQQQTARRKPLLVVELSQTQAINYTALRVLLNALKFMREQHGDLCLLAPHPNVQRVFEICGFTEIFQIHKNLNELLDVIES